MSGRPVFFYDLGSPYAYLAAERIAGVFEEAGAAQPEWQPILLGALFGRFGRDSWANGPWREEGLAEVERRAQAYGLPPIRWPEPFPGNTLTAMRAATFAKEIGRTVSFSLAAFRQACGAGRGHAEPRNRVIAPPAAGLHPRSLQTAIARDAIKSRLRAATDRAGDLGVSAVAVGEQVFWGDDRLEEAAEAAAATG